MPIQAGEYKGKKSKKIFHPNSNYKARKKHGSLPPSLQPHPKPLQRTSTLLETRKVRRLQTRVEKMTAERKGYKRDAEFEKGVAEFEKEAHKQTVVECDKYHVNVRLSSDKQFTQLSTDDQVLAMRTYGDVMDEVRTKMRFTESEFSLAYLYWSRAYGPLATSVPCSHDPSPTSPSNPTGASPHRGRSTIWNEEWMKLHLLRSIADKVVVSSRALRRIFLAVGIEGVNGGKIDRKDAMNLAVGTRIMFHDIIGPDHENFGVWLEPADVIREMIQSAKGVIGEDYNIVVSGDGRYYAQHAQLT